MLTTGQKFQHWNLDESVENLPLLQEMPLSDFVAGNGISSNIVFLQLSNAK